MSSSQVTVDHILDLLDVPGGAMARKMFGEYGIYSDGKMVALVCDDQLFVKPTRAGRDLLGQVIEASPYPGAKPSFLIEADRLENGEWLSELIRATAAELPEPKPKAPRKRQA